MKLTRTVLLCIAISIFSTEALMAQFSDDELEKGKVGIGLQVSYPIAGASAIVDMNKKLGIQGIFGLNSGLKSIGGRLLYFMTNKSRSCTYAYGMLGSFRYTSYLIFSDYEKKTESILGYGIGIGMEYSRQSWMAGLPIWVNMEIGYGNIKFKEVDFDMAEIMVGVGLHYYFTND